MSEKIKISSIHDIKKLNVDQIRSIDPERMDFGTCLQDCALIAATYERGAHATPTEAATFATLTRGIQNQIAFSKGVVPSLQSYLPNPNEDAKKVAMQAAKYASDAAPEIGNSQGTGAQNDHTLQSFRLNNQTQTVSFGDGFGDALLNFAKDCIPCDFRMLSLSELHPNIDLLGLLEEDIKRRLKVIQDVGKILSNFDIYADFCELMSLLSFMCIPDLQRIIAILMALFMLELPEIDGLIGALQALIMPLFSPILAALASLLDQFEVMVTNPLDCVVDAINAQLAKINVKVDPSSPLEESRAALGAGLLELSVFIQQAQAKIRDKVNFYLGELRALLEEVGTGDASYFLASLRKLKIIRTVGFIVAIIKAVTQGHAACSNSKPPEKEEIDNFFDTFLNPNAPFVISIDNGGNLNIDEKQLINPDNSLQFDGLDLVDSSTLLTIKETSAILSQPSHVVIPCKLQAVSVDDTNKLNRFIQDLNAL